MNFVNLLGLLLAPFSSMIGLVVEALVIVGSIIIIFKAKKLGFILICAASVINLVNSLVAAISAGSISTIIGVFIGAALIPVVTFLLMKKDWNMFD